MSLFGDALSFADHVGQSIVSGGEHLAEDGYKLATDGQYREQAWKSAVNDVKSAASLGASAVRGVDAAKEKVGSWIDSGEQYLEKKVDDGRAWLRQNGGAEGQQLSDEIGFGEGVVGSLYDAGKGLVQMADGASSLANPLEWAANPNANIARLKSALNSAETLGKVVNLTNPSSWITDPQGNAQLAGALWNSAATSFKNDPSKFLGSAVATIGTLAIPGADAAGVAADTAKATELANGLSKATAITADAGKATAMAADAGKVPEVTAGAGKVAAVAGDAVPAADAGKTAVAASAGKVPEADAEAVKVAAAGGDAGRAGAGTGKTATVTADAGKTAAVTADTSTGTVVAEDASKTTTTAKAADETEDAAQATKTPPPAKFRADFDQHLVGQDGFKNGRIHGTHNRENALNLIKSKGATYTETPTSTPGVSVIKYEYRDAATGKDISGRKTVYDPKVIDDKGMIATARKAGEKGWQRWLQQGEQKNKSYVITEDGINFKVYVNKSKQTGDFIVDNVHPVE
jgi:hypothetical protein